jgi:alpha-L-rhamnosidase
VCPAGFLPGWFFYIRRMKRTFIFLLTIAQSITILAQSREGVGGLQTEHLVNPIGIDVARPRLSWRLGSSVEQEAYSLTFGADSTRLAIALNYRIPAGKNRGSAQSVIYQGPALRPFTRYYWAVTIWDRKGRAFLSPVAWFETGMMDQSNWKGCWITDTRDINQTVAAWYRKSFTIHKPIRSARVYIAVAGLYELYFNGRRIGDHYMDPMYTRFDRRNFYVTYDVTKELQRGDNVIGVILGNGWYNMQTVATWYFDKAPWRARPRWMMDLRITYTDGSTETLLTDKSWKTTLSNLRFNNIYTGEQVDANNDLPGWNDVNFDDRKWKAVTIMGAPSPQIVSQMLYPIRRAETIPPIECTKLNDTDYVYDLGRNISGISQITLTGAPGTVIRLRHSEKLYDNGHTDISNIAVDFFQPDSLHPLLTDQYTLSGNATETFSPEFSYKGFRYVEVTSNKPVQLDKTNLTAFFTHSDVPNAGTISSSDTIINQLWRATNNSYLANLQGYPTDCPQREKNGWTGDAHMAIEAGLYNFDGITIYEKWLVDIRDEQEPNGLFPAIVPSSGWGYFHYNTVDWLSSLLIIPWELYRFYGDSRALQDNYEAMKRYVDYLDDTHPDGLIREGLGDRERIKHQADTGLTSTCYYYNDAVILAKTARLFHKKGDEDRYDRLAQKISTVFNQKYYHDEIRGYGSGYQTENSMALYWDLVPGGQKAAVASSLAESVTRDSLHLDIGILGNVALLNALSENGYADIAYRLVTKMSYPSWGYWMTQGMTTLAETWNMKTSLNHVFMGEISAWLFKGLGGIYPDAAHPGFKHILLRPNIVAGLDSFTAAHEGPYGLISSGWYHRNGQLVYEAVVPPGSTASLTLAGPGAAKPLITELSVGHYRFELDESRQVFRRE